MPDTALGAALEAAGVKQRNVNVTLLNESAVTLLKAVVGEGRTTACALLARDVSGRLFVDLIDEDGAFLPHRITLDARGVWNVTTVVKA